MLVGGCCGWYGLSPGSVINIQDPHIEPRLGVFRIKQQHMNHAGHRPRKDTRMENEKADTQIQNETGTLAVGRPMALRIYLFSFIRATTNSRNYVTNITLSSRPASRQDARCQLARFGQALG